VADGGGTTAEPARGYRDTIVAAACLGLVWPGDALIYVVLPLYPSVFGVEIATIGVLLSILLWQTDMVVRGGSFPWLSANTQRPAAAPF